MHSSLHKIQDIVIRYAIFFILAYALLIRVVGIDFGLPYLYSPDEPIWVKASMRILSGSLNPNWYGAGTFIIYLLAILYAIILAIYFVCSFLIGNTHTLSEFKQMILQILQSDPTLFYLPGRLLMLSFAVISIYLVYIISKKLYNEQIGILASFCLAISPLHITHSRIIRPDITTTMLVLFSIYFLISFFDQRDQYKWLVLSSLFAGFSIAAKYTSGIIVVPILIYSLICDIGRAEPQKQQSPEKNNRIVFRQNKAKASLLTYLFDFIRIKTCLSRALLFIFIGYFVFAPFTIIKYHELIKAIVFEARGTHLGHERLAGIQNHIWYLKNTFRYSVGGVFFELFAAIGLLFVFFKKPRDRQLLFISFPILFFLIIGCAKLRWSRWLIPVLPFEAILFGIGLYYSYQYLCKNRIIQRFRPQIVGIFLIALIAASYPTLKHNAKDAERLTKTDTRTLAKDWVEKYLPLGSTIAYEHYSPHLHIRPKRKFNLINTNWKKIVSKPISTYKKMSVDYIIITSSFKDRFYKEPTKYPLQISRYEELKSIASLVKIFDNKNNPGEVIEIYKLKS